MNKKINCEINSKDINILHSNNIEDSIKRLLDFHPSLKKSTYQIETAKYELENTEASVMPNVSLRAEHREGDL